MPSRTVTLKLVGDASSLKRGFGEGVASAETFGARMTAIGDKVGAVGKRMTVGLTLPILGLGGGMLKLTADYQKSLNTFQAVSSASAAQMKEVGKTAKSLGADMSLPGTSAKDAAAAMTELAKAGLSVKESMAAAKGVLQLSAAAEIGNAEAATIAANALNAFKLEGKDAARVADILAATANASSAEITDVADAFQQASAVFASNGQTVEDLSTAIGLLANKGIKGSDAGTSLKTAMIRLTAPVGKAKEAMHDLGIEIFDAHGKTKDFEQITLQVWNALKDLSDAQRAAALNTIFGSDAMRVGAIMAGLAEDDFANMREEVTKQGAAAKVAGAKMKGLAGAFEGMKSAAETAAITFGEIVAPYVEKLVRLVAHLIDRFGNLSPRIQQFVLVGAGIAAALGPALSIVGALTSALPVLGSALAVLIGPVGLILAGIALLVAGFISAYHNSEEFRDRVSAVFAKIKGFVSDLVARFRDMAPFFRSVWEGMLKTGRTVATALAKILDGLIERFGPFLQKFLPKVARVLGEAFKIAGAIIRDLMPIVEGVVNGIAWLLEAVIRGFAHLFNAVIHGINAAIRAYNVIPFHKDVKTIGTIDVGGMFEESSPAGTGGAGVVPKLSFGGGGTVPGPIGKPQVAVVHGGEKITTPGTDETASVIIYAPITVQGSIIAERDFIETVHSKLLEKLRRNSSLGLVRP